jgi:hypothetical protein
MITVPRRVFVTTCRVRGYDVNACWPCVVEERGELLMVDETHAQYPRLKAAAAPVPITAAGPGTELKKLLARVGIAASPSCSCAARAREMNARGCDWCEANLDTLVGWLREEATKRKLPFVDMAGRLLVKRAIRNARRAAS